VVVTNSITEESYAATTLGVIFLVRLIKMLDTKYVGTHKYRYRQTDHWPDHYEKEKVETLSSYGMSQILNIKEFWGKKNYLLRKTQPLFCK